MKWPWSNKKQVSKDFVELSIGKVFFYEITNGMLNKIFVASTVKGSVNTALFLMEFEYALSPLTPKQIDNLSLKDGELLRKGIKDILNRNNLLITPKEKDEADIFSKPEKEWLESSFELGKQNIKGGKYIGSNS